jgi:DNA-binding transcriptional LysR family regulator
VSLSPAGVELREVFVGRHLELRGALAQFQDRQVGLSGAIRVGCLPELGIHLIFPHLLAFQKEHPAVRVQIVYCTESQIIEGLAAGRMDFGICAHDGARGFFRAYPLFVENLRILGTPAMIRKLQAGTWKQAPWVSPSEVDFLAAGFLKVQRKRLPFQGTDLKLVANSHRSMCEALLAEIGFAVLPEASAAEELADGRLVALPGAEKRDPLYLLVPELDQLPTRIKALRDHFFKLKAKRGSAKI